MAIFHQYHTIDKRRMSRLRRMFRFLFTDEAGPEQAPTALAPAGTSACECVAPFHCASHERAAQALRLAPSRKPDDRVSHDLDDPEGGQSCAAASQLYRA